MNERNNVNSWEKMGTYIRIKIRFYMPYLRFVHCQVHSYSDIQRFSKADWITARKHGFSHVFLAMPYVGSDVMEMDIDISCCQLRSSSVEALSKPYW